MLEQLLALTPAVGVRLMARLTGGFIDLPPEDASAIELHTQVEAGHGRPDLEVRSPHRLVWVEVKVESELRTGQLEGYRVLLREAGVAQTRLVLLTRYPESFAPDAARPDLEIRWFEVADWLEAELPACDEADPVAGFLTRQFLEFLGERGMTLAQVDKFMPEGVRALSNLMNMLVEAAGACGISVKKVSGWGHVGCALDRRRYWIGVNFSQPEYLCFNTYTRVDPDAAVKLGVGDVEGSSWARYAELESEEIHFFARSKVSQMQWLEGFLRECLAQARSIETPDQPPVPDAPEDQG